MGLFVSIRFKTVIIAVVAKKALTFASLSPSLILIMVNPNRGAVGFSSAEFEQKYDRPSKSQLKRDMTALQKLGAELVSQPKDRVMRVPMPEDVRDAILECQKIKDHEGRRRQMQYVGKKMRTLEEEELAAIQKVIDSWNGASKSETAAMHALERRRDKLLADDKALTDLKEKHPEVDVQQMRTLIRNARREQAENKPPKAYREIFQVLKQLQSGAAAASADDQQDHQDDDEQTDEE
jgi:ribosome-associated protein